MSQFEHSSSSCVDTNNLLALSVNPEFSVGQVTSNEARTFDSKMDAIGR